MKINDIVKKSIGLEPDKLVSNNGKKTEKSTSGGAVTETVTLSPLASEMQTLEAKVASSEAFDAKKVEEIKSAIADGKFKVDSGKIADGLIATVKDLINRNA